MNVLTCLLISLTGFFLAYRLYAVRIERMFEADDNNEVPALVHSDGVDYVPTRFSILFSHHFVSIAGAGPVIGPVLALVYGFAPAWLWIVVGAVFFGAVHDYTALFVSMRERGRSMAEVARISMGKTGFVLFILFTLIMVFVVTAAFLGLTATALTSVVDLDLIGLEKTQGILRTVTDPATGAIRGAIGGIASTSVIFITLTAPIIGYLLYKRRAKTMPVAFLASCLCLLSVWIGFQYPVTLAPHHWMLILSLYAMCAAGVPVWIVLLPRDYINSFILYGGIAALTVSIALGGLSGTAVSAPMMNVSIGEMKLGLMWPILFITVACGAISGFHSLVSSGTTAKQCARESDAKRIGYGAMLLESLLAVIVLIVVASNLAYGDYLQMVFPSSPNARSNPVLAFALASGRIMHNSLSVPPYLGTILGILLVEGFLATTLDTAVRLNRYLFEELWGTAFKRVPRLLKSYVFNAGLSVAIMYLLAYKQAFLILWPLFGTANQLLAGLTLLVASIWFVRRQGKASPILVIPACFMMATTVFSLFYLLLKDNGYLAKGNYVMALAAPGLIALSMGFMIMAFRTYARERGSSRAVDLPNKPEASRAS